MWEVSCCGGQGAGGEGLRGQRALRKTQDVRRKPGKRSNFKKSYPLSLPIAIGIPLSRGKGLWRCSYMGVKACCSCPRGGIPIAIGREGGVK